MPDRTPITLNGVDLELELTDAGLLRVFKQGTEIGGVSTAQEVLPPVPQVGRFTPPAPSEGGSVVES